jgi:hypothetical protein
LFFFGAEFTKALVVNTGSEVVPKKNAIRVPGINEDVIRANKSNATRKKKQSA